MISQQVNNHPGIGVQSVWPEISVEELMRRCGVNFGTSGARGLVTGLTDYVAYVYTRAFLQHLVDLGELTPASGQVIGVGGDLRPSTDRIMRAAAQAVTDSGFEPRNFGKLPSPALALWGIRHNAPTIMVTGSHIPDDRNGIKYTRGCGEVTKADERGMKAQVVRVPAGVFSAEGDLLNPINLNLASDAATRAYVQRYLDVFPRDFLKGKTIGIYQHSAVGRDVIADILQKLGATVIPFARSDRFVPVDTEAIRKDDFAIAAQFASRHQVDALVSADGDSDRPLIAGSSGKWIRGDVFDILVAQYVKADAVVCPVSCNTAVEKCGAFKHVERTMIGSPFVIAGMEQHSAPGKVVCGYEANGGFLLNTPAEIAGKTLPPLPTRDAVLPMLAVLGLSIESGKSVERLLQDLPPRFTASERLTEFPTERSQFIVEALKAGTQSGNFSRAQRQFGPLFGTIAGVNTLDGLRMTFESGEIAHLRPSGNAPEFRGYAEAGTEERANEMLSALLAHMSNWREIMPEI